MEKLVQHVTLEKPVRYALPEDEEVLIASMGGPASLRIVALLGWEEPCEDAAFRRFRVTAIYPHHDDGRSILDREWSSGEARTVATFGEDSDGADYPSEFFPRVELRRDNILSISYSVPPPAPKDE